MILSYRERQERGTILSRRLADDVAQLCPPGIGRWDGAWSIVAPASAEYMAALTAWEATQSAAAKARVRDAYDGVLAAWRNAVAAWLVEERSPDRPGQYRQNPPAGEHEP